MICSPPILSLTFFRCLYSLECISSFSLTSIKTYLPSLKRLTNLQTIWLSMQVQKRYGGLARKLKELKCKLFVQEAWICSQHCMVPWAPPDVAPQTKGFLCWHFSHYKLMGKSLKFWKQTDPVTREIMAHIKFLEKFPIMSLFLT